MAFFRSVNICTDVPEDKATKYLQIFLQSGIFLVTPEALKYTFTFDQPGLGLSILSCYRRDNIWRSLLKMFAVAEGIGFPFSWC